MVRFSVIRALALIATVLTGAHGVYVGNTGPYTPSTTVALQAGRFGGFAVTVPTQMTLTDLIAHVAAVGTTPFRLALYTDEGGLPKTLVSASAPTMAVLGMNVLPVPSKVLAPGKYWIMANGGPDTLFEATVESVQYALSTVYGTLDTPSPLPSPTLVTHQARSAKYLSGCVSACGDPHFTGLDGNRYDFQGENNKAFALVSDRTVQLNAMFRRAPGNHHHRTYLYETCLRACDDYLLIDPREADTRVVVNHRQVKVGERVTDGRLSVLRTDIHKIEATVRDRWFARFSISDNHINVDDVVPLFNTTEEADTVHGVIGHTVRGPFKNCNIKEEGGCEVQGSFKSYEVAGELCSTQWPHSMFAASACSSSRAHKFRV